jgi:hypothetical protein
LAGGKTVEQAERSRLRTAFTGQCRKPKLLSDSVDSAVRFTFL